MHGDQFFLRQTVTFNEINRGLVNVLVGFAPLKPAEFAILTIRLSTCYQPPVSSSVQPMLSRNQEVRGAKASACGWGAIL